MEEIIPRLFVGSDKDYEKLQDRDGWSWVRCCKEGIGGHRQTLGYSTQGAPQGKNYLSVRKGHLLALNFIDPHDPAYISTELIQKGLDFISERIAAGDKVLVACNQGHSRGPTMALLYLRSIGEMPHSFGVSERIFSTLCPQYSPNQGMRTKARQLWAQLVSKGTVTE